MTVKTNPLDSILLGFSQHVEEAPNFPQVSENLLKNIKQNIKHLYDHTKAEESKIGLKSSGEALKELVVDDFDLEQIWQQIELQNKEVIDKTIKDFSGLLVAKDRLIFESVKQDIPDEEAEENEQPAETDSESSSDSEDDNFPGKHIANIPTDNSSDEEEDEGHEGSTKEKGSVVDDDFFKLSEMNKFLDNEENPKSPKDDDSDEESVDLFEEHEEDEDEDDSADEAKMARFKDYFGKKDMEVQPKRKRNKLMEGLDIEDESDSDQEREQLEQLKSSLEQRQERLKRKIDDLEEQAVAEKPWQLKGEVTADKRPQNSLLEEIVDFDMVSRPAPVITAETSMQLEDIIRQRIKDKLFDSVERKLRPVETPFEYKKELVLNQEKSKESLANIYEKQFLERQAALDQDKIEAPEEEPESHKEVRKLMKSLFSQLDALSNYHFTTTPAVPELKVVNNLPAISMEEVAPVAYSDASLLAPEEIRNKPKAEIVGKSERTDTDKKRERRKKKLKQKIHSKRKAEKETKGPAKKRVKS